jgi:GAF domain-containing protein
MTDPPHATISVIPPRPFPQEPARIRALHEIDVLDSSSSLKFDRLTALAADVFSADMAMVSLLSDKPALFLMGCALDGSDLPADASFCSRAIRADHLFVVEDTVLDARFRAHPMVVGPPNVRFYAGAALRSARRVPVGTLCLIDSHPRIFTQDDRRRLIRIAELVEQELENHDDMQRLRRLVESPRLSEPPRPA